MVWEVVVFGVAERLRAAPDGVRIPTSPASMTSFVLRGAARPVLMTAVVMGALQAAVQAKPMYKNFGHKGPRDCQLQPSMCQEVSDFIVVMDAGSTGTRAHVYYYPRRVLRLKDLPLIASGPVTMPVPLGNVKVTPGVSSFVDDHASLKEYFDPLFQFSKRLIRQHDDKIQMRNIPLYLGATAGMRLLSDADGAALIEAVAAVFNSTACPFGYRRKEQSRILSGEEEAAFEWLAVNALHKKVSPNPRETFGILDIGGGSAQVAFIPEETSILAGFFAMHFGGADVGPIHLYTHSFLAFGRVVAFQRSCNSLLSRSMQPAFEHPCMPKGVRWRVDLDEFGVSVTNTNPEISTGPITMKGSSNFTKCLALSRSLLPREMCFQPPCAILGVYMPGVGDNQFALVGGYASVFETVKPKPGQPPLQALRQYLAAHCDKPLEEMPADCDPMFCWKGTWALAFLVDGLGFPMDSMALSIPKPTPDWTLGQALYEVNFFPYQVTTDVNLSAISPLGEIPLGTVPRHVHSHGDLRLDLAESAGTAYNSLVVGAVGFLAGMATMAGGTRCRRGGGREARGQPLLLG